MIRDYFDFLDTEHAYGQEQRTKLGDLGPREKRDLGMKIRDHIAQGRVYMCSLYLSDADMEELEGDNYDCKSKKNAGSRLPCWHPHCEILNRLFFSLPLLSSLEPAR